MYPVSSYLKWIGCYPLKTIYLKKIWFPNEHTLNTFFTKSTLSGKTSSDKIFPGENHSSSGKYFVTFPRHFSLIATIFLFFIAFNIINQSIISIITTSTSFTTRLNVLRLKLQPERTFLVKTVYFHCCERILFSVKSFVERKLVYGENLTSVKINRRGK